jgi:hypothetical protein
MNLHNPEDSHHMQTNTLRSFSLHSLIFAGLIGLSGCIAHGQVVASADLDAPHFVFVEPPMLVAIEPGVWVVHDYRAQIFFVGDAYWHVSGGVWYRADFYDGDWLAVSSNKVSMRIRKTDETRYVHFAGDAGAKRKQAPPMHAAAQHGGPPGQRDDPGLGLGHDDSPGGDPGHSDKPQGDPGHSNKPQGDPGHSDKPQGDPGHSDKPQGQAKQDKGKGKESRP